MVDVLVRALSDSAGLPVPTEREYAKRVVGELRMRGYVIAECDQHGNPQPVDNPVEGS